MPPIQKSWAEISVTKPIEKTKKYNGSGPSCQLGMMKKQQKTNHETMITVRRLCALREVIIFAVIVRTRNYRRYCPTKVGVTENRRLHSLTLTARVPRVLSVKGDVRPIICAAPKSHARLIRDGCLAGWCKPVIFAATAVQVVSSPQRCLPPVLQSVLDSELQIERLVTAVRSFFGITKPSPA
jgi:hypothetical protein